MLLLLTLSSVSMSLQPQELLKWAAIFFLTPRTSTQAQEHAAQIVVTAANRASAVAAPHSAVKHGAAVADMATELRHSQATSVGAQPTAVAAAEMQPLCDKGLRLVSGEG